MWSTLLYQVFSSQEPIYAVAVSFLCSYAALWLSLIYDAMALVYNNLYENISKNQDTSAEASKASADEVP